MLRAAAFAVALGCVGCAGLPSSGVVQSAQQACISIQPQMAAASLISDPKVQSIVGYANAMCGPLASGMIPSTVDSNTSTWLGSLSGMLKVIAPIALMMF